MDDDPTRTNGRASVGVRPADHERRGHGAAVDHDGVRAFLRARRHRQAIARGEAPEGWLLDDPAEATRERARHR